VEKFQFVVYKVENFIGRLTIKRPPVNALNRALVGEIISAADLVNDDVARRKARVLILQAEGKNFCAGADLKERLGIAEGEVEKVVQGIRNAIEAIAEIKVPTIAAVQGTAAGGGMELALAADIRIAADTAKMGLRETALAIIPGAGGTQRLTRLIGYSNALLWICTAGLFDAADCLRYGVVSMIVPEVELENAALQLAEEIAANGPLAVQLAKSAMLGGAHLELKQALELEWQHYKQVIPSHDRREALQAFNEKRPPVFKGE
jgi:enoyl-CoA hydratase/carnithine racemase